MRLPLLCLLALVLLAPVRASEPFFKKGDVIALVGGEDMVVASEYGYLELLLTRALPDYKLRFRNLAWEGDTVFEQRRDLNFPTWEEALDKIGATVVIAQFGQMESLAGKEKLPEFIAAYEKLIERFGGGGKRRVLLLSPTPAQGAIRDTLAAYNREARAMAGRHKIVYFDSLVAFADLIDPRTLLPQLTRDGLHLNDEGARVVGGIFAQPFNLLANSRQELPTVSPKDQPLLALIRAKNKLWFDYWRPQNWAFLAGDRTAQPSSRDHLDPSKRWFPPEREAFLPLIEAKEKEIDALAAQLAAGK